MSWGTVHQLTQAHRSFNGGGLRILVLALALTTALGGRGWLEAGMVTHMLVQLPLLVLSGWLSSSLLPQRLTLAKIDQYGITGLSAMLFIATYWMIPRALELSLTSAWSEAGKIISLIALGMVLPGSLQRCPWVGQIFFLGNIGAMTAIAGIEYQQSPERLCNAYLIDDQSATGIGLTIAAVLISVAWAWRLAPALKMGSADDRGG